MFARFVDRYLEETGALHNVRARACPNECFESEHAEALAILGCGTVLAPGRFLAANNGGHNHHGAATGQWVEGGTWENAGDDTIHGGAGDARGTRRLRRSSARVGAPGRLGYSQPRGSGEARRTRGVWSRGGWVGGFGAHRSRRPIV